MSDKQCLIETLSYTPDVAYCFTCRVDGLERVEDPTEKLRASQRFTMCIDRSLDRSSAAPLPSHSLPNPLTRTLSAANGRGGLRCSIAWPRRFTSRSTPGIAHIRDPVRSGVLGKVLHFSGRYWTDFGWSPAAPIR
jgi:hypothetical protein